MVPWCLIRPPFISSEPPLRTEPLADPPFGPEVLPPHKWEVSGCHLSSFLCLSEDYQVAVHAGSALGEAGEACWDIVELHRGDMLLMVATSRHYGMINWPCRTPKGPPGSGPSSPSWPRRW